jgi:hypothetical protein
VTTRHRAIADLKGKVAPLRAAHPADDAMASCRLVAGLYATGFVPGKDGPWCATESRRWWLASMTKTSRPSLRSQYAQDSRRGGAVWELPIMPEVGNEAYLQSVHPTLISDHEL